MQGVIVRISGPVVDVKFEGYTPKIYEALEVEASENSLKLILETEQLLAAGLVRTVAMGATEGLKRNLIVTATGNLITVPVGPRLWDGFLTFWAGRLMTWAQLRLSSQMPSINYPHC